MQRALALEGASNFRDLGGYRGFEGRPVRWRRLFRSDHLIGLTRADAQQLAALGITRTIDFRGVGERQAAPYFLPGLTQHPLPIEPTVVQGLKALLSAGQPLTEADTVALMQHTYRAFVTDNAPRFAALFAHLLHSDQPLVFHCTAGKDRTGFAAALVLLALGVARDEVMQDYLLSNPLYRPPADLQDNRRHVSREVVRVLWTVQPAFLQAALDQIDTVHGGIDTYLREMLHLDAASRERLRALYLAPAGAAGADK